MRGALEILESALLELQFVDPPNLSDSIGLWLSQMKPTEYDCLGCEYCFPAMAMNIFDEAFPEVAEAQSLCCDSEVQEMWLHERRS